MNRRADKLAAGTDETVEAGGFGKKQSRERSRRAVYMYVAALFVIVVGFILLSYFMQHRNNSELSSLDEKNATAQQNIESLQSDRLQLQAENEAYARQIEELEADIEALKERIGEIRQQWLGDVRRVRQSEKAAYDALQAEYDALIETYGIEVEDDD